MDDKDKVDIEAQETIRRVRDEISLLDAAGRQLIFTGARTFNGWLEEKVSNERLREIYDLMKMCPTSGNCCPIRIKFLTTDEAKQKLEPILNEPNRAKTMLAPVIAIFGNDHKFFEHNDFFAPHRPGVIRNRMEENPDLVLPWANLNGTLQAAYFILAVRAVGLDAGPMQGLNKAKADEVFWSGTDIKTNFVCSIGRGDEDTVFKRLPRFEFNEVCEII